MSLVQDNSDIFVHLPDFELNRGHQEASKPATGAVCAPPGELASDRHEIEQRSPLREISDNAIEVADVNEDQVQQLKNQDVEDDGLGNINEYVARILEKLEKQKQKCAKSAQIEKLAHEFEEFVDENDCEEVDDNSKENLSPLKGRQAVRAGESPVKEKLNVKLDEVLHISKHHINFGNKFPGQIAEEHLDIVNKSDKDFVVRIEVDCFNEELQDTEEYVFSVRRSHLQEYNDRHYLIMAPYSCASFKFALKVPNIKRKGEIEGQIRVSIEDVSGSYVVDMKAQVSVPKVFCPKELKVAGLNHTIINLAVKEGKKQDFKLPIKNTANVPVTMELEFYEPNNGNDSEEKQFDCVVHPQVLTVPANGAAQLNFGVKPYRGFGKKTEKKKPSRRILVGKVRDSAIVYSFVFGVEFY